MSVRIVHLADVHLGAPLANFDGYAETRRAAQETALERAVDLAIERRAHAVVVAGDLFDTFRPPAAAVHAARRALGRLREAGIPTLGVPGTHDSLGWSDCVYHVEELPFHHFFTDPTFGESVSLEVAGVRVVFYGIAYDPARTGEGWSTLERTSGDGIHVAIAHAACRMNPEWTIAAEDLPFDEAELAGLEMDYVALGHYHNTRLFERDGRVVGAYSGSILGRDWTEPGPRHVLLVEWGEPGAPPEVIPVEIEGRTLATREVDVSGARDQAAIAAAIEHACPTGPLWNVSLTGDPDVVPRPETIVSMLEARFDHLRIVDESTLFESRILAERAEEETVRGEFFRRLIAAREMADDARLRRVADRAIKIGLETFG